jgi:pyruvate,water dikinase
LPTAFRNGFGAAAERLGLPFGGFEIADVNGWFFGTFLPLADEDFPARMASAELAIRDRSWRTIADEWTVSHRVRLIRRNQEIQRVDVAGLDDRALFMHLAAALELLQDGASLHFRQSVVHWVAVGMLANESARLAGWAPEQVVRALAGASPSSMATLDGLRRIVDAIAADPQAAPILAGDGDPREVIGQLRANSATVSAAIDEYLDVHGWQVFTGFDFTNEALCELPGLLLATIRSAATPQAHAGEDLAVLRAAIDPAESARFEILLEDALVCYGLRDDDSGITIHNPLGLVRRALLEAGDRLTARGAIHDHNDVFDATSQELAVFLGGPGVRPSADELSLRSARRKAPFATPPRRLGEEGPPPDGELPPAMATIMGAIFTAMALEDTENTGEVTGGVQGVGASAGVYEGRARLISGPGDFELIEHGDVLIAALTTPAYNVVLPLVGALVTDRGGILSHPAIVAREFNIPAVVGTGNATALIRNGDCVRVDGTLGTVTLLT